MAYGIRHEDVYATAVGDTTEAYFFSDNHLEIVGEPGILLCYGSSWFLEVVHGRLADPQRPTDGSYCSARPAVHKAGLLDLYCKYYFSRQLAGILGHCGKFRFFNKFT